MGVGSFSLPINSPFSLYQNPSDWASITGVPNNEIYLLTSDIAFGSVAFTVTTSTGTYNVDWGDGNSTTGITSGTRAQYIYTHGSGLTGTTLPNVTTFRCRIYATSGTITRFFISQNSDVGNAYFQSQCILSANFGTTGLTSMANAFFGSGTTTIAYNLKSVFLPTNLNSCTTMANAFQSCTSLERCDMPVSMTGCTSYSGTFASCNLLPYIRWVQTFSATFTMASCFESCWSLYRIDYPTTMNQCNNMGRTHIDNYALVQCNLPTSMTGCGTWNQTWWNTYSLRTLRLPTNMLGGNWNRIFTGSGIINLEVPSTMLGGDLSFAFNGNTALTSIIFNATTWSGPTLQDVFRQARALKYVKLPTNLSGGDNRQVFRDCINLEEITLWNQTSTSGTNMSGYFWGCSSLRIVNGISNFGSTTSGTNSDGSEFLYLATNYSGATFNQRWSRFGFYGTSTQPNKATVIRLNNTFSGQWTGASPQINVSWNSLGQAALVDLFNDLITVTAKTIDITGNPGASLLTPAERAIATGKGWTITG